MSTECYSEIMTRQDGLVSLDSNDRESEVKKALQIPRTSNCTHKEPVEGERK